MKIIREPVKNPHTNQLEIGILFTADEIDFLNGQKLDKYDKDDPKAIQIQQDLDEGFYQARRKTRN